MTPLQDWKIVPKILQGNWRSWHVHNKNDFLRESTSPSITASAHTGTHKYMRMWLLLHIKLNRSYPSREMWCNDRFPSIKTQLQNHMLDATETNISKFLEAESLSSLTRSLFYRLSQNRSAPRDSGERDARDVFLPADTHQRHFRSFHRNPELCARFGSTRCTNN